MDVKYNFYVLDKAEKPELWDNAVKEIDTANFFHTSDWLFFVEKYFQVKLRKTLIYASEDVHGVFPFFEKKYGFYKIAGSPLFLENVPYMGFALKRDKDTVALLTAIDSFIKNNGIDFFRASFDDNFYSGHFQQHGYLLEKKVSFRLDLSRKEELLWKGLGQKGRNLVRKAEKNNFVVEIASDLDFIDSYYAMSKDVFAHKGLPPLLRKSYYNELFTALNDKGFVKIFMLNSSVGEPVAGAIILICQEKAYYLDGVSYKKYQTFGINNYLQWKIIQYLQKAGITHYDMTGGGLPGVERFKKSFGTTIHPTLYVEKSFSFFSKFARSMYAKKRLLKKKMDYYFQWKR